MNIDERLKLIHTRLVSEIAEGLFTDDRIEHKLGAHRLEAIHALIDGQMEVLDMRLFLELCAMLDTDVTWVLTGVSPAFNYEGLSDFHKSFEDTLLKAESAWQEWMKLAFPILDTDTKSKEEEVSDDE